MKKAVSILLSLISVICISFTFAACEDKQAIDENKQLTEENKQLTEEYKQLIEDNKKLDAEYTQLVEENKKLKEEYDQIVQENKKLDEDNKQLIEENGTPAIDKIKTIESGKLYSLRTIYDNGLLKYEDMKSIACRCYDYYKDDENPYSGMFDQQEELSEETANQIKQAYLNQVAHCPEGSLDNVNLLFYCGTYNGNIVIKIYSDYVCFYPAYTDGTYIGGVLFKGLMAHEILVYHI